MCRSPQTRHASLSDTVPPWTKEEEAALILLRLQNQDNFYKVVFPITPGRVIKHKNLSGVPISPKPSFRVGLFMRYSARTEADRVVIQDYRESSGNDADEDSTTIVAGLAAGTTIMPQPLIEMKPPTLGGCPDLPLSYRYKTLTLIFTI